MQSTQLTPRLPRTSVRQTTNNNNINNNNKENNHIITNCSRIPHQVQPQQQQQQQQQSSYCNGISHQQRTLSGDNQIVANSETNNNRKLSSCSSSSTMQNVGPTYQLSESLEATAKPKAAEAATASQQQTITATNFEEEEKRNRYLTFNKDQASSHVKSLKEELFNCQQAKSQQNKSKYHSSLSATAKAIEQKFKKSQCDQQQQQQQKQQQQQQLIKHERYFINLRNQANGQIDNLVNRQQQEATTPSYKCSLINSKHKSSPHPIVSNDRPKPLERLSKLPQQQQQQQSNHSKVFPSPRNSVKQEVDYFEFNDCGDENNLPDYKSKQTIPVGPNIISNNNNNNNASFRQQPVCEAFIMTGQSMMKLSTTESDQQQNNPSNLKTSSTNNNTSIDLINNDCPQDHRCKSASLNKLDNQHKQISNTISSDRLIGGQVEKCQNSKDNNSSDGQFNQQQQQQESDISSKRRAFIMGNSNSVSSMTSGDSQRQSHHELAPLLWAQQQQSQRKQQLLISQQAQQQQQQQQQQRDEDRGRVAVEEEKKERERRGDDEASAAVALLKANGHKNQRQRAPMNIVAQEEGQNNGSGVGGGQPSARDDSLEKQQQQQQQSLDQHTNVINNQTDYSINKQLNAGHHNMEELTKAGDEKMERKENDVAMSTPTTTSTPNVSDQIDRDSARRLAKRLYNLSGFKRSDVCHHLAKNNPFSQMVAEEYLKLFDFRSMKFDAALRKFLSKLLLNGETQERERILSQFSNRYYECNKDKFPSADTVQTLVCAIILLNTDLHGNHIDRKASKKGNINKRAKLSLGAWIDGLNSSLKAQCGNGQSANLIGQFSSTTTTTTNDSSSSLFPTMNINNNISVPTNYSFPRHLLVDLYESIKKRPLKCGEDKSDMTPFELELDKIYSQQYGNNMANNNNNNNRSNTLPSRRFAPGSNAPSSTLSANSRRQLKQGLSQLNDSFDDRDFSIEFKSGFLFRKRIYDAQGKPTPKGRRGWRRVYAILKDLRLIIRYNYEPQEQQFGGGNNINSGDNSLKNIDDNRGKNLKKMQTLARQQEKQQVAQDLKNTLRIHHSIAKRSSTYTKREYVFHLRLADQSELLLQATSESEMNLWIDTINFASACLSSPALPSAVSNSKRYQIQSQHRPILSASYTKLSYWEQLIDHEERLQRFKIELDEHINEAPQTKNADKRVKSEFIEKIAHLKQELERYNVYVELMRKKSNSPEALILSKHPQIASLIPSDEMIKSLPSFAPPQKLEESLDDEEKSSLN